MNLEKMKVLEDIDIEFDDENIEIIDDILNVGKCGNNCYWLYDKEDKVMYIYGEGEISKFEGLTDEIKNEIIEILMINEFKTIQCCYNIFFCIRK